MSGLLHTHIHARLLQWRQPVSSQCLVAATIGACATSCTAGLTPIASRFVMHGADPKAALLHHQACATLRPRAAVRRGVVNAFVLSRESPPVCTVDDARRFCRASLWAPIPVFASGCRGGGLTGGRHWKSGCV